VPANQPKNDQKPPLSFPASSGGLYQAVRLVPDLQTGHLDVQLRPVVVTICAETLVCLQMIGQEMHAAVADVINKKNEKRRRHSANAQHSANDTARWIFEQYVFGF